MPATQTNNGSDPASASKATTPKATTPKQTLAQRATTVETHKRRPVFKDVPNIPRVGMEDGRIGAVQAEVMLDTDGSIISGPHMLTVVRKNADGSESGARFPLADVQYLADAFKSAGFDLV